jgi:hypothetical protein
MRRRALASAPVGSISNWSFCAKSTDGRDRPRRSGVGIYPEYRTRVSVARVCGERHQATELVRRDLLCNLRENRRRLGVSSGARDLAAAGGETPSPGHLAETVERARWTDERLVDRMSAIDTSFQRVFEEMRAERGRMSAGGEALRMEMRAGFAETRSDISALQRQVTQICAGFAVASLGVVATGIVAAF